MLEVTPSSLGAAAGGIHPHPWQPGPGLTYTVNPKGSPLRIPRSWWILDPWDVSELKIPPGCEKTGNSQALEALGLGLSRQ